MKPLDRYQFRCSVCKTKFKAQLAGHALRALPHCPGCGVSVNEEDIVIPWERTKKVARALHTAGKFTGKWTTSPVWAPPYFILYLFLYSLVLKRGGGAVLAWNVRRKANKRMRRLEKQRAIDDRVREANDKKLEQENARQDMLNKGMASLPTRDVDADAAVYNKQRAYPTREGVKKLESMHVCKHCGAIWPSVEMLRKCESQHDQYKQITSDELKRDPARAFGAEIFFGRMTNGNHVGVLTGVGPGGLIVAVNWDSDKYVRILDQDALTAGGLSRDRLSIQVSYNDVKHARIRRPNYLLREGTCSPQHLVDKKCYVLNQGVWGEGRVAAVNTNQEQRPIMGVGTTRIPCLRRPEIELVVRIPGTEITVSNPNTIYIME